MTGPDLRSRFRAALRAVGWSLAFVLVGFLFTTLLVSLWGLLVEGSVQGGLARLRASGVESALVQGSASLTGFLAATWVVGFGPAGLRRADLRWAPPREGIRGFLVGLLLGIAPAALALGASVLLGGAVWLRDDGSLADYAVRVGLTALVLAPAALSEEVIFRGVPLVLLGRVLGRITAVVAIAALFGVAHLFNPQVTPLGVGNIALAGVFLGLAFYAPGGVWTAFGAHLGWNATLAALDAPVSGLPFDIPYLDYHPGGPAWLTGGAFGPEGGVLATLTITAAVLVTARLARKELA
ncbi:MAG TPA: type II CAAX endopeptidase family protein [Gemmatimonadales bacterium]|nr:type II CAAX endopeptidase family protein [Gemmatimonadales bacterium]